MFGIWCFDDNDWLRDGPAIVAYESKRPAWSKAAGEYGYATYTEAKRAGWCEVRPLTGVTAQRSASDNGAAPKA